MKYKLWEKHPTENLYRIVAIKDFANIKEGTVGGWVKGEHNLAQEGNCWVYGNACVYEGAWVYEDACVSGNAHVYRGARLYENAQVYGGVSPQKEWVGLTDEEIYDYADKFLYSHGSNYGIESFGKAIEAKLKEKNT